MADPTPEGLLDTNVVMHALTHDAHAEECVRFVEGLERGTRRARLEPMVLHELSYALGHYVKGATRAQIAQTLLSVLSWPGVTGEKAVMADAVHRWLGTPGLAFVDAYLAAVAVRDGRVVYSKNVRELIAQGVAVPDPLPS